jgi:hypothetical protein
MARWLPDSESDAATERRQTNKSRVDAAARIRAWKLQSWTIWSEMRESCPRVGEWFRSDGVVQVLLIERWTICLETGTASLCRPCLMSATGPPQLDRFEPFFDCSLSQALAVLQCYDAKSVLKHS